MMQLLSRAGISILMDDQRLADANNPAGYYEFSPVKKLHLDNSWLPTSQGKAVKVVTPLSAHLPPEGQYKVLYMVRSLTEIVESQEKMLWTLGRRPVAPRQQLMQALQQQQDATLRKLSCQPSVQLLRVPFSDFFTRPADIVSQIFHFLQRPPLSLEESQAVINPQLYRNRLPESTEESRTPKSAKVHAVAAEESDRKTRGIVVVSVPKSGTNFLSQVLAQATGWRHRWGRPSRDVVQLFDELPLAPNSEIYHRAVHLIATDKDLKCLSSDIRPPVFGKRQLAEIDDSRAALQRHRDLEQKLTRNVIMSEHPIRSLAYWLRNPAEVPLLDPAEVVLEAKLRGYGVVFLRRDFRDVVNSLAHFLHAGTRYVQFNSWSDSIEIVLRHYAPVLAKATRLWLKEFDGLQMTYEELIQNPDIVVKRVAQQFDLTLRPVPVAGPSSVKAFTFRQGGTQDWRNHLSQEQLKRVVAEYSDLLLPLGDEEL